MAGGVAPLDANGALSGQKIVNGTLNGTDVSRAMFQSGLAGSSQRYLSDKFVETIDVKDAGALGDGVSDDTAAINAAIAQVNARLAAGTGTALFLPPGAYSVGVLNPVIVPQGTTFGLFGSPGGTTIRERVAATTPILVQERKVGSQGGYYQITVRDLTVQLMSTTTGGNGVEIDGTPVSQGGGTLQPTVENVSCINNGAASAFWMSCVKVADAEHISVRRINDIAAGIGNGDPSQGTAVSIYTTPDAATANFSVDHHISDVTITGGFAAVRSDNHVEGLQIDHVTAVGSTYGLYAPAWMLSGGKYGVNYLTLTGSHLNTKVAGVYCEACASAKFSNDLMFADAPVAFASNAALPIDLSVFASGNTYAWAGIWCPNCASTSSSGDEFFGFKRGGQSSTAFRLSAVDLGAGVPALIGPTVIAGDMIQAMSSGPLQIDGAYQRVSIIGNTMKDTTVGLSQFAGSHAVMTGNVQDDAVADFGVQAGNAVVKQPLTLSGALTGTSATFSTNIVAQNAILPGAVILKDTNANTSLTLTGTGGALVVAGGLQAQAVTLTSNAGIVMPKMNNQQPVLQTGGDGRLNISTGASIRGDLGVGGLLQLASYTVSTLPGSCTAGQMVYVSDGRKNGEASGSGSGVPAICTLAAKGGSAVWSVVATGTTSVAN
ncbi:glycosyl hydrolase family 28-related protein [Rhizosaccharibacter radicis]|uniref:Glycoside hydrolase family 55 protein n=1 Tax=Rhizosaccharibacter radicis TaxID=2782605 RepID=A0ABT1VXE3_9PROT|nr:glycoside hydrolase family 55 protein [Acetobacteraceae bacterium KSS12]